MIQHHREAVVTATEAAWTLETAKLKTPETYIRGKHPSGMPLKLMHAESKVTIYENSKVRQRGDLAQLEVSEAFEVPQHNSAITHRIGFKTVKTKPELGFHFRFLHFRQ